MKLKYGSYLVYRLETSAKKEFFKLQPLMRSKMMKGVKIEKKLSNWYR